MRRQHVTFDEHGPPPPKTGPTTTTGVTPMPTQDMHEQADEIEQAVNDARAEAQQ